MGDKLGFEYTCQKCKKRKKDVHQRTFKGKHYVGPCGDSFCHSSCDNSGVCFQTTATICNACEKLLKKAA
jgi:hypothetical protein